MLWFKGALILHVRWWTAPTPMQMHCLARTANGEPNSQDRFSYLTHEDFIPFWNAEMQMQNGRLVELQPHSVDENEKGWVHQFVLWMWAYIGRPGDHILHHTMFATRDWLQSNKKKNTSRYRYGTKWFPIIESNIARNDLVLWGIGTLNYFFLDRNKSLATELISRSLARQRIQNWWRSYPTDPIKRSLSVVWLGMQIGLLKLILSFLQWNLQLMNIDLLKKKYQFLAPYWRLQNVPSDQRPHITRYNN